MSASVVPNGSALPLLVEVDDGERLGRAGERGGVHVGDPVRAAESPCPARCRSGPAGSARGCR